MKERDVPQLANRIFNQIINKFNIYHNINYA